MPHAFGYPIGYSHDQCLTQERRLLSRAPDWGTIQKKMEVNWIG